MTRGAVRDQGRRRCVVAVRNRIDFRCNPTNLTGPFNLCVSRLDGKSLKRFPWPLLSVHPIWGTRPRGG